MSNTQHSNVNHKEIVGFDNPDVGNPVACILVIEAAPTGYYDAAANNEYDCVIYMLEGEMVALDEGDRPIRSLRQGEAMRMSLPMRRSFGFRNQSSSNPARFIHLVIEPNCDLLSVTQEAVRIDDLEKKDQSRLIASSDGRQGSLTINNEVDIYLTSLRKNEVLHFLNNSKRRKLVHLVKGSVDVGGVRLPQFDTAFSLPDDAQTDDVETAIIGRSGGAEVLLIEAA